MLDFIKNKSPLIICDIGASPIDKTNFIDELYNETYSQIIGFEPNREEYNKARNFLPIVEIGATELALQGQQLTGGFRSPQEIYNRPNVPTRTPTVAPQPSALRQQEFNKLLGID